LGDLDALADFGVMWVDQRIVGPCALQRTTTLNCGSSQSRWGLPHRGYKQPRNAQVLAALVDDLLAAGPWLDPGPHESLCRSSHDAADAVIAALTACAAQKDLATRPDERQGAAAHTEGWIALPTSPLRQLP
jgi:Protein of unknown function (DUF429)